MSFNALDALRAAGIVTGKTSPAAIGVLSELNESEVAFLSSLDTRIKAAMRPEVVAHSEEGGEDTPCVAGFTCGHFGSDNPVES
jgi:hypothetical protein